QYILGNLEHCKSRIQQYVDVGVQHFQIYFIDYPSTDSLETFAREIFPLYRCRGIRVGLLEAVREGSGRKITLCRARAKHLVRLGYNYCPTGEEMLRLRS
ncbi:MAG TPA: hypothetical protein DCF78_12475, partial [Dehalococcoidia bacterium]|nr:hypothetical protein [Dehalococcoidia bacterium]